MKKFFELSATTRKSAKGELILTLEALTKDDIKLGQLDITLLNDEYPGGVFFKYIPTEACNSGVISKVRLSGRDEDEIREALEAIPDALRDSLSKPNADANVLAALVMISVCINPSDNSIMIPEGLGISITRELMSSIFGDDWLGIELQISPELSAKIHDLTISKKEKDKEKADTAAIIAALQNALK